MQTLPSDGAGTRGRRSILLGGVGAVVAFVANNRMSRARAADGDAMRLGERNRASGRTTLVNTRAGETAFRARAGGSGAVALDGLSPRGTGVHGLSTHGNGVSGETVFGTAVSGLAIEPGSYAVSGNASAGVGVQGGSESGVGVQGNCQFGVAVQGGNVSETEPAVSGWAQNGQTGVLGLSTALGGDDVDSPKNVGVFGVCDRAVGRGVLARSERGHALEAQGRVKFGTAGLATVAAGQSAVSFTATFTVTASTKVVAMPQADPGPGVAISWVEVDVPGEAITIHLSAAATGSTPVAWFAFE